MWVLVRPKPKIAKAIEFFKTHQCQVVGYSPIDIVDSNEGLHELATILTNSPHPNIIPIVTSTEAAARLTQSLQACSTTIDTAICVGESSAELLQSHVAQCLVPLQRNSEGVVALIRGRFSKHEMPADTQFVLIKGAEGRDVLPRFLSDEGYAHNIVCVYKRIALIPAYAPDKIHWHTISGTVVTSVELLEQLIEQLKHDEAAVEIKRKPMVVVSERMKQRAQQLGISQIVVSDGASNAHLLRCVERFKRDLT